MVMSSGAGAKPLAGQSGYGAAKAGLEHWVKVAREEFRERPDTWIVAVRPGLVKTAAALSQLKVDPALYPRVCALAGLFDSVGVDIDTAAKRIWAALPPRPTQALISFEGVALPGNAAFA
jgi:NAD(P)-dependent dehydrogenase (short-subunit alcohol dehydrogenase family)